MRYVVLMVVTWALAGCGRLVVPSELRPAGHPLLELGPRMPVAGGSYATSPRLRDQRPAQPAQAATRPAPAKPPSAKRPAPARPQPARKPNPKRRRASARPVAAGRVAHTGDRRTVRRTLEGLVGSRRLGRGPLTDSALVRAAFARTNRPLRGADGVDDVWSHSAPIRRAAKPGDLLFFQPTAEVPRVCVVRRRLRGGVVEAACATRGAVRWVRVSSSHPNVRRRQGRVINTFLRQRRRTDPPRARYLAGQLLWQIRTPFAD